MTVIKIIFIDGDDDDQENTDRRGKVFGPKIAYFLAVKFG